MQHSVDYNNTEKSQKPAPPGQGFAIMVESLYIANLLILPVISFIILVYLFLQKHGELPTLAKSHLEQTISAGLWIALMFLLGGVTIMIMRLNGIEDITLWLIVIITFTLLHATMVLFGIVGLSKALSGKCWPYPLVGKSIPYGCNCDNTSN